jgi:hypothetical protein
MPTFEQTLIAGETLDLPGGEQFHVLTGSYGMDITFYAARRTPIETWQDMRAGFRYTKRFDGVRIANGATGQTIKVAITGGDAVYNRSQGDVAITGGIIDNVTQLSRSDAWLWEASHGSLYIGGYNLSAQPGYAHVQLLNPAGSGKVIYVKGIMIGSPAATVNLHRLDAPALNFTWNGTNCYIGNPDGVGKIYYQSVDPRLGTNICGITFASTGAWFPVPLRMNAGTGIAIVANTTTTAESVSFLWAER